MPGNSNGKVRVSTDRLTQMTSRVVRSVDHRLAVVPRDVAHLQLHPIFKAIAGPREPLPHFRTNPSGSRTALTADVNDLRVI